ncbi:alpha/beta-hydrolase [Aspergillus carlsbadensis]|nr:alpha/beta-hydrolase [Aspergillus carlsbadensis]
MSSSSSTSPPLFNISNHIIDTQHIREYPHATKSTNDALTLAVKQYTPKSNPNPQSGDLTIVGAHGTGFPKELYEPIWEELYTRLQSQGGASGLRNAEVLGNDPSWFDHARDLLYMINQFKAEMPSPIVGIGHSLGAGQLALLSLLHPRLLSSLILVEPVIEKDIQTGKGLAFVKQSLARKDAWASREDAGAYFAKQYRRWDARVLRQWVQYGLRDVPFENKDENETDGGSSNNNNSPGSTAGVALVTSRHQEVTQYLRPNFQGKKPLSSTLSPDDSVHDATFHPDVIGPEHAIAPFYRYEPLILWKMLKQIRPSVLYLFGEKSPISTPDLRAEKLHRTGSGIGGSGGCKRGMVKEVTIAGAGHHLPFERVSRVAGETAGWLKGEMESSRRREGSKL